jgi:uncharacterized membrane protein
MDNLKTHKLIFWCALALMVAFGIILIHDYTTKTSLDPLTGWLGLAAMALTAIAQFKMIRDIKKHK